MNHWRGWLCRTVPHERRINQRISNMFKCWIFVGASPLSAHCASRVFGKPDIRCLNSADFVRSCGETLGSPFLGRAPLVTVPTTERFCEAR